MKGYKAFEKGLICKGKQYAENTVFEEDEAEICKRGMHFCKNPLDVLDYYPLIDGNGEFTEFAEVEALDEVKTDDKKKFCTKKLKVGAKLSFAKFIEASVKFDFEKIEEVGETDLNNSKNSAQIGSSGDYAKIGSSGDYAQIGSSGYYAKINSEGKYAVICCAGHGSIAKGKLGSWITLSEWQYSEEEKAHIPVCVKTAKIDGKRLKEDTYYKLENGKFKQVKQGGTR